MGILASLNEGEAGLLQVLFVPVRHPWHENIITVAVPGVRHSIEGHIKLFRRPPGMTGGQRSPERIPGAVSRGADSSPGRLIRVLRLPRGPEPQDRRVRTRKIGTALAMGLSGV